MDEGKNRISLDNLFGEFGSGANCIRSDTAESGLSEPLLKMAKQAAYGDAFGKAGDVLRILFPDGVSPDFYDDLLGVVRVIDKLFRIATARDALGEDPWEDLAGYGLLGAARCERSGMTGGPGPARSDPGAK
jgi:hypothetical protein